MNYFPHIVVILFCLAVAGIILLIRHICGKGSKEYTIALFVIVGAIALIILLPAAMEDVFENSSASFLSWFFICTIMIAFVVWAIIINHDYRNSDNAYKQKTSSAVLPIVAVILIAALFFAQNNRLDKESYNDGYSDGYDAAYSEYDDIRDDAYHDGYEDAYDYAYDSGYNDGVSDERAKSDDEWDQFFLDAMLVNPYTDEPIQSREDFYEWKTMYDAELAAAE